MWKRGGAILLALSILFGTGGCRQETETSVKPIALVHRSIINWTF